MMTPALALAAPTILLIEDYPDTRELLSVLLYRKGYKVVQAATGPEGLLMASRACPDLILLDLALPEMDGIESARRIHDIPELSQVPIFVFSSYLDSEIEARIRESGCVEIFGKPFDLESLLETISITLGER